MNYNEKSLIVVVLSSPRGREIPHLFMQSARCCFVHLLSAQLYNDSWISLPIWVATNWQLRIGYECRKKKHKAERKSLRRVDKTRRNWATKPENHGVMAGFSLTNYSTVCLSWLFVLAVKNWTKQPNKTKISDVPLTIFMPEYLTAKLAAPFFFSGSTTCVQPTPDFPATFESSMQNLMPPRWILWMSPGA